MAILKERIFPRVLKTELRALLQNWILFSVNLFKFIYVLYSVDTSRGNAGSSEPMLLNG